ncbi:MAG: hypothetical protein ABSE90_05885, partial [Verrucomicrobiota bacterium]
AWGPRGGVYKEEFTFERAGGKRFIREQVLYGANGKKAYALSFDEFLVTFTRYAEDGETVLSKNDYTAFNLVRQVETLQGPLYLFPTVSKTPRGLIRVDYHKNPLSDSDSAPEATVYFTEDGQRTDPFGQVKVGADEESVVALLGPPSVVWQDEYFRRTEYKTPTHKIRYQWKLDAPKKLDSIVTFVRYE